MRAVPPLSIVVVALWTSCMEQGVAEEVRSTTAPPTIQPVLSEPPTATPLPTVSVTPLPSQTPQPTPPPPTTSPPPTSPSPTPPLTTPPPLLTTAPPTITPNQSQSSVSPLVKTGATDTTALPSSQTPSVAADSQRSADVSNGYPQVTNAALSTTEPLTREQSTASTGGAVDEYHRNRNTSRWSRNEDGSEPGANDEDQVPRVIGGREDRNQVRDGSSEQASEVVETEEVSHVYHVFKYIVSLSTVASLLMLLLFHGLAVDDRFDWSRLDRSPNTWEFVIYVSYVQHLLSVSQMVLVKAPYSLWTMLDALSWTGFLPYHSDTSAIDIGVPRQLDTILLSGLVAFADRVGVKEGDLLVRSTTNLVVFIIAILALFFIAAAIAKRQIDYRDSLPPGHTQEEDARVVLWRKISMQVCGLLILLWLFALYPLSVMASYELSAEIRAGTFVAGQLLLVVITLPSLCLGGLLSMFYQVASKSESELLEPLRFILWGSLYADYTYDKRVFLVAPVLLQITSGVVVGSVTSGSLQASMLIALHAVFVLLAVGAKPFVSGSVAPWFLVVVSLLKITNLSLCLASFTSSSELTAHTRASVADAVIYLNALLVFCWTVRHVTMLAQVVHCLRDGSARRDYVVAPTVQEEGVPDEEPMPLLCAEPDMHAVEAGGYLRLNRYK